jgi:hypothetical protein
VFTSIPADLAWHLATLTPAELATVRYIDYPYWTDFSGGTGWSPTMPALYDHPRSGREELTRLRRETAKLRRIQPAAKRGG